MTDTVFGIALGFALSAACGFRVFVPLLALSLAAQSGHVQLAPGFGWIGSDPALLALATATLVEVLAYYVPWLDHLLDTLASPAAMLAGAVATASVVTDLPPLLHWSVAVIGGGGAAGIVQGASVLMRIKSAVLTGGLANPLVATAELAAAVATSLLALIAPAIALCFFALLCAVIAHASARYILGRRQRG